MLPELVIQLLLQPRPAPRSANSRPQHAQPVTHRSQIRLAMDPRALDARHLDNAQPSLRSPHVQQGLDLESRQSGMIAGSDVRQKAL
jgi:hypothetical protein